MSGASFDTRAVPRDVWSSMYLASFYFMKEYLVFKIIFEEFLFLIAFGALSV